MTVQFPAFLKLEYQRDGSAAQTLLADVETGLSKAERRFREFSDVAQAQVDIALGRGRNSGGSLDLDVPGLQAAAKAQEARAIAAREVAQATALAAREEGDYSQKARLAVAATEALAREQEQAAASARSQAAAAEQVQERLNRQASATKDVVNALNLGTTANRALVNSSSAVRQATVQAGQQLQDVAISLYSGQRATVVFAQQLPQLAFALTGLEGSANKTQDRIGRFATLLAGPWGLAVGLAAGATVGLIGDLIGLGDESDDTAKKTLSLADALGESRYATDEGRKAIDEYNAAQERQRDGTERMIALNLRQAESDLAAAKAKREDLAALLEKAQGYSNAAQSGVPGYAGSPIGVAAAALAPAIAANEAELKRLEQATRNLRIEDAKRSAEGAADPVRRITNRYEDLADAAIAAAAGNDALSRSLTGTLSTLEKQKAAAIEAQRASERGTSATNRQFGREVNSSQARAIAEAAGFRVNSADRTIEEQRWLYNNRRTPQNPVAFPDANAPHVRGNALDIAFGAGVTPASIRKAFADEGVRLTKLLKETGHFHIEWSTSGADRAAREADAIAKKMQELREYGERAADQIANITGRFDEQPRLIDAAAAATRQLDAVIRELAERQPPGFGQLIEDAERAKGVIEDALVRPFRELAEDSAREVEVQRLLLGGREKEAAVLSEIWRFQELLGDLTADQRAEVERVVLARENELEVLDRLRERQSAYLQATQSVRQEFISLFAGEKADFGRIAKRLQAQVTVEAIFGDSLRLLDKTVQSRFDLGADAIKAEGERVGFEFGRVADAANGLAASLAGRGAGLGPGAANDNGFANPYGDDFGFQKAFFDLLGGPEPDNVPIEVTAQRDDRTARAIERSAIGLSPSAYADMLGRALVAPLLRGLPQAIAGPLSGILGGAAGGYATGGATGGVLGALRGGVFEFGPDLFGKGLTDKLLSGFDKALGGAATGTQIAGIGNSLGIKLNSTGAQIGGALGSFIPIPGGQIIGSIAGGLLGGLFEKKPRGAASVTEAAVRGSTNDTALTKAITGMGSDIQGAVRKIADALGADVGAFDIGLGRYKDYFQVSSKAGDPKLGNAYFARDSRNALYDGKDEAAAAAAALAEAIRDGAIKGLSTTAERILRTTPDVDAAVQKILDFQSVFERLRGYKDPIGAAMDGIDKEFSRLRGIFDSAGASAAEYAQLEELFGIERAKAIKEASESVAGSLRDLLNSLNIGDSGLSLRDRQANALARYDGLATRVRGGDVTAYDDYARSARDLLDIERQIFGSTEQYFARFNEVRGLSQSVVDAQQRLADQAAARDSGADAGIVRDSVNSQTQVLGNKLDAVNDNLIAVGQILQSMGGQSLAARYGLNTTL